jgi:phosphoglycolate phosphatase-like HAD superfamily hydrolase
MTNDRTTRAYLVLFDIDGTLLWSDGAGRRAMEGALRHVFGTPGAPTFRYDGKTDKQIAREVLRLEGHADEAIDERIEGVVEQYLTRLRSEVANGGHVERLPGVPELLDALEARDDVVLGLLTGNVAEGAMVKLTAAGIDITRFRVNAFGSDHEHRPRLPEIAQRRALELLGLTLDGADIVVIGDTPADIDCARSVSARTIAVATGRYTVEELAEHAPTAVFTDLSDTSAVLAAILA